MIKENLKEIIETIEDVLDGTKSIDFIKSLRIDKRKPYTDRLFFFLKSNPNLRVCLHTFQSCNESESFAHPHSWESEVLLLEGKYNHSVFNNAPLVSDVSKEINSFFTQTLSAGSSYHINTPYLWHKVTPLTECKTIMVNGLIWEKYSKYCKFTKGKELIQLTDIEKRSQLLDFYLLLNKQYNEL